jgi:activator of 2-hydroxyglutaryl-CoA dehydratase
MNDKRAGGTGAVIDKINAKLKIPASELSNQAYHGIKLHKVACARTCAIRGDGLRPNS